MPGRTVKFVSAIFAGILGGILLTATSRSETAAPDSCLLNPRGETPSGTHWYYRIEHGTKRHCWYLLGEGEKVSQAGPQNILPPQRPPAPAAAAPAPAPQHSLADAHAELSSQFARDEGAPAAPSSAAPAAVAPRAIDAARLPAGVPPAIVASRWPDPSAAIPTTEAQPANGNLLPNLPADPAASPATVDAAVIPADADWPPYHERGLLPLLVAIFGALTLAAAIVVRLGRPRRLRPRIVRGRSGPIWETTDDDRIVLSDHHATSAHMRRPRFARSFGEADERKAETYRRTPRRARA
jgi:hypothetical protein